MSEPLARRSVADVLEKIERARAMVRALCNGQGLWVMSILVIADALDAAEKALTSGAGFEQQLPRHDAGLSLTHNDHLTVYRTVAQLEEMGHMGDWVSEEEKGRAIEANDCWTLTWFPDTPVGSYSLSAHSLTALLASLADLPERAGGRT